MIPDALKIISKPYVYYLDPSWDLRNPHGFTLLIQDIYVVAAYRIQVLYLKWSKSENKILYKVL